MKHVVITVSLMLVLMTARAGMASSEGSDAAAGQAFLLRAAEYAGFQIPASLRLKSTQLEWRMTDGIPQRVDVGPDGRLRAYLRDGVRIDIAAEVFELADDLFYASFSLDEGKRALTLVADRQSGRVMQIESRRPEAGEGTHQAQVVIGQGRLDGARVDVDALLPVADMAGVRLIAHYAEDIAYEHIYLNPQRVTWHGVTGPEAGVADTERYEAYRLRDDVYLVSWSEKVLTTHMIFLFNFATEHEIGTVFGYEPEYDKAVLETIGAKTTVHQGPVVR